MKKLWLAERHVDYEGSNVLGVFTSKAKAMEECQLYEIYYDEEYARTLEFRQHQTSENHPIVFLADGHRDLYSVHEFEINTPLMRKAKP